MNKDTEHLILEEIRLMREEMASASANMQKLRTEMKRDEMRAKHMFVLEANIEPKAIAFGEHSFTVDLMDGRSVSVPLAWFPRLLHAQPEQLQKCKLSYYGIHWEDLGEDISIMGLLAGRSDRT